MMSNGEIFAGDLPGSGKFGAMCVHMYDGPNGVVV